MSDDQEQPQIEPEDAPVAVEPYPDGEPVETGVPDEIREEIAGEPGRADGADAEDVPDDDEDDLDDTDDEAPLFVEPVEDDGTDDGA